MVWRRPCLPWPGLLASAGRRGVKRVVRLGGGSGGEAMRALAVVGWEDGREPLARSEAALSAVRMKGIMRSLTASMSW